MAIVDGVNSGFVTVAPTGDPGGTNIVGFDGYSLINNHISPVGNNVVIEIGYWQENANASRNFEVGIYNDNGSANILIGVDRTNATGTGDGVWIRVTGLNIPISSETLYWIAAQIDSGGTHRTEYTPNGSFQREFFNGSTLPDIWPGSSSADRIYPLYAVYEEAVTGFTRKIKISGTFQDKPIKTKVSGSFEDKIIKIKVGGAFQDA